MHSLYPQSLDGKRAASSATPIAPLHGPARASIESLLGGRDLPADLIGDEAAWSCIVRLVGAVRDLSDRLDLATGHAPAQTDGRGNAYHTRHDPRAPRFVERPVERAR